MVINESESWVDPGQTYEVSYTIENNGTATAAANHVAILRVDGADVELDLIKVSLDPSENYSDTFDSVVVMTDCEDNISVYTDVFDDIIELDEDNNYLNNTFQVADLIVASKSEEWVVEGQTYRVNYMILNQGKANASSNHSVLLWVDDVAKDWEQIPDVLGPNENYSNTFESIITLTGYQDEIRVEADSFDKIAECNESNNDYVNIFAIPTPTPTSTAGVTMLPRPS